MPYLASLMGPYGLLHINFMNYDMQFHRNYMPFFKIPGLLNNNVTVVCDCGHVWCFQCREEGHWPASCDEAKKYRRLMQQGNRFALT